jgi:hypothetical protein
LPLLRRMLAASEEQKLLLEAQIQCERSKQVATGPPPGMQPSKRLHMLSHTETMSSGNGETTFHLNSQPDKPAPTPNSFPLTRQSELKLEEGKRSCLPTKMNSCTSTQPSSSLMAFRQEPSDDKVTKPDLPPQTSVDVSIARESLQGFWY